MSASTPEATHEPEAALVALAEALERDELLAEHVSRGPGEPTLGLLAAAGPRARGAPGEYAFVIEAVREGYLAHHGTPRLLAAADADLALLAGDYLYALGLDRLAALGDLEAVTELADLISLVSQQLPGPGEPGGAMTEPPGEALAALWLAAAITVAVGPAGTHEAAKAALRRGEPTAPGQLLTVAVERAAAAGLDDQLTQAAEAIGFPAHDLPQIG